jgi:hypothetical protein
MIRQVLALERDSIVVLLGQVLSAGLEQRMPRFEACVADCERNVCHILPCTRFRE